MNQGQNHGCCHHAFFPQPMQKSNIFPPKHNIINPLQQQSQSGVVKRYYSKSRKRRQGVDKSLSNPRNQPFNPNVLSMNVQDNDTYIKLKESI